MRVARFRLWLALAAATVLAVSSAFLAWGSALNIFGAGHGGMGLGPSITIAVISTAALIVCGRWVVHLAHRLRTRDMSDHDAAAGQPAGSRHRVRRWLVALPAILLASMVLAAVLYVFGTALRRMGLGPNLTIAVLSTAVVVLGVYVGLVARAPRTRDPLHRRRQRPGDAAFAAVLLTLIGAGFAGYAVYSFGQWRLSEYVQAHGELVSATVVSVDNIAHAGRNGATWYEGEVHVALHRPVSGTTAATVHETGASHLARGRTVTVRVDPHRPGYAEFPGQPYGGLSLAIMGAVAAAFFLEAARRAWLEVVGLLRQRYQPARRSRKAHWPGCPGPGNSGQAGAIRDHDPH